jgi:hypothetical protein
MGTVFERLNQGRSKVGVCEGGVGIGDDVSCSLCVFCSGKVLALLLGSQLILTSSEGEDGVGDGGPAEERLKIFIVLSWLALCQVGGL